MTRLILQSKMLQSLMCAQNAPLFTTKHQANIQSAFDSLNCEVNYDPYQGTSSQHPPEKPEIHVGKPCMANPCSQESVYNVMKHSSVGANENCK